MKAFILITLSFLASSFSMAHESQRTDSEDRVNINSDTIPTETPCIGHICVGNRIIDKDYDTGEVLEVFDNGKARVTLSNYWQPQIRDVSSLGRGFRCIENVCEDARVVDSNNQTGRITELFDNGIAIVHFDNTLPYESAPRSLSSLGIELSCLQQHNCSCRN